MAPAPGREPDPLIGKRIDDYLLVSVLGVGGFGKVLLALQLPIMMKVALKLMHEQADTALAARLLDKFEAEARALATLSHPHIVRLVKYGLHDGRTPYLVMEFVDDGRTLKHEIADKAAREELLDLADARHILVEVTHGLAAAHARDIVHRDIKPENIMLQRVAGDDSFVRILDFGLAKFVAGRDETSVTVGTPIYMAPEQLERRSIGPWTDWYAVGVIAFELLTGRRPFTSHEFHVIMAQKLDPEFDPVAGLDDLRLPESALAFFRTALARAPEARYRTAEDFRAGLDQAFTAMLAEDRGATSLVSLTGLLDSSALRSAKLRQQRSSTGGGALHTDLAHGGHGRGAGATLPGSAA
ncbi:MAG: serine/threonine protein kinase, partial [Deltaproteobacteria bacterium]